MKTNTLFASDVMNVPRLASAIVFLCLACGSRGMSGQTQAQQPATPTTSARHSETTNFSEAADAALAAMRHSADEQGITGVAVVSYCEGDTIQSWTSRMLVVGRLKEDPSGTKSGANFLAIAYAKASEMAETLKDSGSKVRPPMAGEVGWVGGAILRGKTGYLIAAFSGGKSEEDLKVSHAGLDALGAKL